MRELPPKIWHEAWMHFKGARLIQCGNGLHPADEMCANCYPKERTY